MQARRPITREVPRPESAEQWEELIDSVVTEGEAVVETENGVKAAIISYEEFREFKEQQRTKLLERLRDMEERQSLRNADLSEEDIEDLADRFSREVIDDLAGEGKLVFERDQK